MSTRYLRSYVKTLRLKAKEILAELPNAKVTDETYRSLIVNFNNTYATIQEFDAIITELESKPEDTKTEE
jgi:hypothetical protein